MASHCLRDAVAAISLNRMSKTIANGNGSGVRRTLACGRRTYFSSRSSAVFSPCSENHSATTSTGGRGARKASLTPTIWRFTSTSTTARERVEVGEVCRALADRFLLDRTFPLTLMEEIEKNLKEYPPVAYAGFDPTAPSLHVGNLIVLNTLLHLYKHGFQVIFLIGGATAQLGDPSGVKKEREEMEASTVHKNAECLEEQILRILTHFQEETLCQDTKGLKTPIILNNLEWYASAKLLDFVGGMGRKFRVGNMLHHGAVRSRMEDESAGINYSEFSYQIFQAIDWLNLYRRYQCRLQVGGVDQTPNILQGFSFLKKEADVEGSGLLVPLLTGTDGQKVGKSTGDAIWLDPDRTSPYMLYQFFIAVPDAEVHKYLLLMTFLPLGKIETIVKEHKKFPERLKGQKVLAEHAVRLIHGEKGVERAVKCSEALFSNSVDSLASLSVSEVEEVFRDVPNVQLDYSPSMSVLEVALHAGCFRSEKEAIQTISAGGLSLNNNRTTAPQAILVSGVHINTRLGVTVLRAGKRRYFLIRWKSRDRLYSLEST